MKRRTLFLTVIFFCVLFCSLVAGCNSSGRFTYKQASLYSAGAAELDATAITGVNVYWLNGNVTVSSSSEAEKITFRETVKDQSDSLSTDYTVHYAVVGSELRIAFQKSGTKIKDNFSKSLEVTVPASKTLNEFKLDLVNGSVSVEVPALETEIDCVNGTVNCFLTEKVSPKQKLELDCVNCTVNFTVSEGVGFDLEVSKVSLTVNNAVGAVQDGKRYVYGDGYASIELDIVNGTVNLLKDADAA